MSDPTQYSGTGEFPAAPEAALPPRVAFESRPASLCPAQTVDTDVVPPPRVVPEFPAPYVKPRVAVPLCQPPPPQTDCIPFQPLSALAFDFNGRRLLAGNTMDRAWCTLTSFLNLRVNTADQWRVEPCEPGTDVRTTKRIAVYGGKVVTVLGGGVSLKQHWPSGNTDTATETLPFAEPTTAVAETPADNTIGGFWNHLPTSPADLANSQHPLFLPGNFQAFGAATPDDPTGNGVYRMCYEVDALPAYVYWKRSGNGVGPGTGGDVVVTNLETATADFEAYQCTMLAIVYADGRIVQKHSSDLVEYVPYPEPYKVIFYGNHYMIYLPTSDHSTTGKMTRGIWIRNGSVAQNNVFGLTGAGGLAPPTGQAGAWYLLEPFQEPHPTKEGVTVVSPTDVWAYLDGPDINEAALFKIGNYSIGVELHRPPADGGADPDFGWYDNARRIATIRRGGGVDQHWTGVIVQQAPSVGDSDFEDEVPAGAARLKKFKSLTNRPVALTATDWEPASQCPSLKGFREATQDTGGYEPFPLSSSFSQFHIPSRKETSDTVELVWFRLSDFTSGGVDPQLWDGRFDAEGNFSIYVGTAGTLLRCNYTQQPPSDALIYEVAAGLETYPVDGWLPLIGGGQAYLNFDMATSYVTIERSAISGTLAEGKFSTELGTSYEVSPGVQGWRKYIHGPVLLPLFPDGLFTANTGITRRSLGLGYTNSIRNLNLYKFNDPDPDTIATAADVDWSTRKNKQKLIYRRILENNDVEVRYGDFNPVPAGDATKLTLKWSNADTGYKAVAPVGTASAIDGTVTTDDDVVVGIETDPASDGGLVRAVTRKMGAVASAGIYKFSYTTGVVFSNAYIPRGAAVQSGVPTNSPALSGSNGDIRYVGLKINMSSGDVETVTGTAFSDIIMLVGDPDWPTAEFAYAPICSVINRSGVWKEYEDFRPLGFAIINGALT